MPWYFVLLLTLAILILPFVIGSTLARRWRMPDHGWKIGLILCTLSAGLAITILGWPPKLGIDLSGGVILIYEVDRDALQDDQPLEMDKLIMAVARRVNPGGVKEVTVRPYGEQQIEIIIPEADEAEVERIKRKISSIGSLEFRILANPRDHAEIITDASEPGIRELRGETGVIARWVPVADSKVEEYADNPNYVTRKNARGQTEVLVVMDEFNVTGQYLQRAASGADERGRPAVKFTFTSEGGGLFSELTRANLPDEVQNFSRQLGILLDGYLQSSPRIQSVIYDQGEITGIDNQAEVDSIVEILNAGSLPTALQKEPVSELFTGPTLGQDTILRGEQSMILASLMVMIFMIIYYRFAGMIATIALFFNVVLTVAIMITIKAAFTLPGLAGLVLTVGMAVDANILIFERIREEMDRGASLKMAIRNGFSRAMSAIIDSNITTLLTAVILYWIGTDQIKGFAVTLFLGLCVSMFTAIFCAHVAFDVAERLKLITQLKMMQAIKPTNINFVAMTKVWIAVSVVLIAIGLAFTVARARRGDLLDIDFTGGSSVQILFKTDQPQQIADIRAAVENALPDVAVSDVNVTDESRGTRFLINTSERDLSKVQATIQELFAGKLAVNQMTFEPLATIEAKAPAEAPATDPANPANNEQSRLTPADAGNLLAFNQETPTEAAPSDAQAPATTPAEASTPTAESPATPAVPQNTAPQETVPQTTAPQTTGPQNPVAPVSTAVSAPTADDFVGGVSTVVRFEMPVDHDTVKDLLEERIPEGVFQIYNEEYTEGSSAPSDHWYVKVAPPIHREQLEGALKAIGEQLASKPFFPAVSNVGGAVASTAQQQALYAIFASIVVMVVYIWFRFQKLVYGIASVVALVHDVLVTLGALAVSAYIAPYAGFLLIDPFKINLPIVAAFMTILGYSINDTIVTFDRLREIKGKSPNLSADMINAAVNQTLARTILTSLTVFMTVIILYMWGGQGIHGFAFALVVGSIAGVYSTVFIAAPIVLWMQGDTKPQPGKKVPSKAAA